MNYIKVSNFFNCKEMAFLLGAFFGRFVITENKNLIYSLSSYKKSRKVIDDGFYEKSKEKYLEILNQESEIKLWHKNQNQDIRRAEFVFILENDLNLDEDEFFRRLYIKIINSQFFQDEEKREEKAKFARAFFELRGSIDTQRALITQDYFYNSIFEIRRARLFCDNFLFPIGAFNLNFRELQNEYINEDNKRNTQLRINLYWYISQIGILNPYKVRIINEIYKINFKLKNNIAFFNNEIPSFNDNSFLERFDFYSSFIYEKDINKQEIKNLREKLKLDIQLNDEFKRDSNIVRIIKQNSPDICQACKNKYDIKDRSFLTRFGRYYTEIHHVVSVGKDKQLDVLENLAKLCPTCHRALGRSKSSEKYQKELIDNILNNNFNNLEFAKMIFGSEDKNYLINQIYENLK